MELEGTRLQKALAQAGVGSRRACDDLVAEGRVTVNGAPALAGTRIDVQRDVVAVDGRRINLNTDRGLVYMLNKPRGVVTTMADDQGRPCVGDLVRDIPERLFHVGRLDEDTSGLLLLTNDGDLSNLLMHPSHGVQKVYLAKVRGRVGRHAVEWLCDGVRLEDGLVQADAVSVRVAGDRSSVIEIVIHEGRKRIVRRMCKAVGHPVEELERTQIGSLRLGSLPVGEMRLLNDGEVQSLRNSIL